MQTPTPRAAVGGGARGTVRRAIRAALLLVPAVVLALCATVLAFFTYSLWVPDDGPEAFYNVSEALLWSFSVAAGGAVVASGAAVVLGLGSIADARRRRPAVLALLGSVTCMAAWGLLFLRGG